MFYTVSEDRSKVNGLRFVVDAVVKKGKEVNSTVKGVFQFGVKGVENCVGSASHVETLILQRFLGAHFARSEDGRIVVVAQGWDKWEVGGVLDLSIPYESKI